MVSYTQKEHPAWQGETAGYTACVSPRLQVSTLAAVFDRHCVVTISRSVDHGKAAASCCHSQSGYE